MHQQFNIQQLYALPTLYLCVLYLSVGRVVDVSSDTPPIIRSLKLHWQALVFYTWEVVGRVVDVEEPRNNKLSYTVESYWSFSYIVS